jgi:hypothetical protein
VEQHEGGRRTFPAADVKPAVDAFAMSHGRLALRPTLRRPPPAG